MELNALTAVYRTHDGLLPKADHQIYSDAETLAHFARMAKLFRALFPYRRSLMQQAAAKGYPVVRHPFLHYPDTPELLDRPYQFMLGADLFVAPVLDPGREQVQAMLPPGRWVNIWTEDAYGEPGRATSVTLAAPLGQPAVLFRQGSAEGSRLVEAITVAGLRGQRPQSSGELTAQRMVAPTP
jgi:alpha-glucosidase